MNVHSRPALSTRMPMSGWHFEFWTPWTAGSALYPLPLLAIERKAAGAARMGSTHGGAALLLLLLFLKE